MVIAIIFQENAVVGHHVERKRKIADCRVCGGVDDINCGCHLGDTVLNKLI